MSSCHLPCWAPTSFVAAVDGDGERRLTDGVEAYLVGAVHAEVIVGRRDFHEVVSCAVPGKIIPPSFARRRGGAGG